MGDGTVTVKWRFKKLTKVRLFYDKFAGGPNGTYGSWVLGSPAGGGVGHMPSRPGIGTITLVDNTTQHPPDPGDICEETTPKSDCGTVALLGPPLVGVSGDGKRRLVADLARVDFDRRGGAGRAVKCSIGQARTFRDIFYSGRANEGILAIPMASISAVAHRRRRQGGRLLAQGQRHQRVRARRHLHRRRHPQGDGHVQAALACFERRPRRPTGRRGPCSSLLHDLP